MKKIFLKIHFCYLPVFRLIWISTIVMVSTLLITNYSLSQWLQQNSGTSINLSKIQFVNSQTGWAGGFQSMPTQYNLIKSTNGGINWISQISNFPFGNRINSLCFLDANTGYIAGGDGLFKTTNGGNNYSALPQITIACIDCYFINSAIGWVSVATSNSEIYRTTNGGSNWISNLYSLYPSSRYTYIRFANPNTGWCVNDSIFKTTNGGINWTAQVLPVIPNHNFKGVFSISPDTAWVVGTFGLVLSTVNGGTNWVQKNLSSINSVLSVHFLNSMTGYITTNISSIYKTTNNGTNWLLQFSDTSTNLNSICFPTKDSGYVCGSLGKIFKTINGGSIGIKKIDSNIPSNFLLYQNYPNPFNPSTVIGYSLLVNGFVNLKVYDFLGREIATLVNEFKKAGSYEIQFPNSKYTNNQLPSGVYFYKLTSGDPDKPGQVFSETKKLVLLK